jgi:hypothetical protein
MRGSRAAVFSCGTLGGMTAKNPLFEPDETGWHAEARDGDLTVIAVRESPWCTLGHFEGLSDRILGTANLADVPDVERRIAYLKQEVEIASAGWGRCKTCHPSAEYDHERANAKIRELRELAAGEGLAV